MNLSNLFNRKRKKTTPKEEAVIAFAEAFSLDEEKTKALVRVLIDVEEIPEGDGNAVWLEPMTDAEYATYMHEQEHGWKKVYDKLLGRS